MARAKRTDRNDARRRYRAEQAALAATEPETDGATVAPAAASTKAQAAPGQRPGITATFRAAYRPAHVRDDLRALPQVVSNWGFLAAIAGSFAAVAWFVVAYSPAISQIPVDPTSNDALQAVVSPNPIPYFLGTMVLQAPPAVGAFIIGFTAKRASWLGGLIYGTYAVILVIVTLQTPAGRLLTGDGPTQTVILSSAAWSPMGAALFASALAWYRRFLDLANPNRGKKGQAQPSKGKPKQKPAR